MHENIGGRKILCPPVQNCGDMFPHPLWNSVPTSLVYYFRHCDWIDLIFSVIKKIGLWLKMTQKEHFSSLHVQTCGILISDFWVCKG